MNAAEVPEELVEKAKPALRELLATEGAFAPVDHPRFDFVARHLLAAVLPLHEATVLETEADRQGAEVEQIERAQRLNPDPARAGYIGGARGAVALMRERAARLRAAETERTS